MSKSHLSSLGEEGGTNWGWEEVVRELEWSGVTELVIEKVEGCRIVIRIC